MLQSEERVSVSSHDRLLRLTAAAILIAASSDGARAQAPVLQLRGTEDAPISALRTQPPVDTDDNNYPNGLAPPNASSPNGAAPATALTGPKYGIVPQEDTAPIDAPSSLNDFADPTFYGQPRPKRPKLYQLPRLQKPKPRGFPPLPPLTTYKTAPGMQKKLARQPVPAPGTLEQAADPPPTVAVIPVLPVAPKPKREEKPYDPVGINVGSLRLFPYVEGDTGYDSNPNRLPDGVKGSIFLHGEAGGRVELQWSQQSLTADLRAGYYDYLNVPNASRPEGNATITGRVDITRTTQLNLISTFGLSTQSPGSPQIAIPGSVFITNRPLIATFGQIVGVSQQFNRLRLDLRGSFDRVVFGNAEQSNNTELLLSLDNYNTYGLTGRLSYELTPGLIPYIQLRGDDRIYDSYDAIDGFARNSTGIIGKVGSTFELGRLITGDIGVGYADRTYVDQRLPHLKSPTIDAKIVYAATPLTTLSLLASTDLSETTVAYASGAVSYRVGGQITHQLLRNLTLTGTAAYQINQYEGVPITEHLYTLGVGVDYNLTRSIVIRGSFTRERLGSNTVNDDYTANVFLVGLKFQR